MTAAPSIPRDPLVRALADEWAVLGELLDGLGPASWAEPTALPGWSVQDNVAHIVGTEASLLDEQPPPIATDVKTLGHVRNDIGAFNERWVEALRSESPAQVHARYRDVTRRRLAALTSMTQEAFDAPSWTPAGQATYGRFMQIRLYDTWMHEQDIRQAVDVAGNETGPAAECSLDEASRALGFIIGKRAGAPRGTTVTVQLTGPVVRTFHVAVEGRAEVVEALDGPPTVSITMTSGQFMRLTGGRVDAQGELERIGVTGDRSLGARIVLNLAFTI